MVLKYSISYIIRNRGLKWASDLKLKNKDPTTIHIPQSREYVQDV